MPIAKTLLSFAWEAPQTLLGVACLGVEAWRDRVVRLEIEQGRLLVESTGTGLSLGHVVFWTREHNRWQEMDDSNRWHELGHTKQSRLLGWLYLPLVGVPSISRAAFALVYRELTGRVWTRYYEGYPEKWADRLGGVVRDHWGHGTVLARKA
jgi:hypothetical protein